MNPLLEELAKRESKGGSHTEILLKETLEERLTILYAAATASAVLEKFPHLSNADMVCTVAIFESVAKER